MCGKLLASSEISFDVEEDGAGDVLGLIFGARVAAGAVHEQAGVDHPKIGRAKLGLQPVGRNQQIHGPS